MKNYVTEFIGTFFLVLTIGLTVVGGTDFAPLAIGSVLMVMVYMGGHVSGAHYNPAVTLAVYLRGKLTGAEVAPYVVAQVIGSLAATFMVHIITLSPFAPAPAADAGTMAALLVEVLFTFALALVVLNVATADAVSGEFLLRSRDRLHGDGRRVRRGTDLRGGVQPGGRHRTDRLECGHGDGLARRSVALPCRTIRWRRDGRIGIPASARRLSDSSPEVWEHTVVSHVRPVPTKTVVPRGRPLGSCQPAKRLASYDALEVRMTTGWSGRPLLHDVDKRTGVRLTALPPKIRLVLSGTFGNNRPDISCDLSAFLREG